MNALGTVWNRFWFRPVAPWPLGLCRAVFFTTFYGLYLTRTDLRAYALFPDGFFQPRSFFAWLSLEPPNGETLGWLVIMFKLAVILSAVGLLTRIATATSCLLSLYLLGLPFNFGYLHWAHAVVPLVMGVFALAPCGDTLALDQAMRQRTVSPGGQYHWPIQLVRLLFVSVFLAAGLAKLRAAGLDWIMSDTLRHYLMENQYIFHADAESSWGRPLAEALIQRPKLCQLLAGLALLLELSAPTALFSTRARAVLIPSLFLFQVANALLLYQDFFFAYLGLYTFWLPWPSIRRAEHIFSGPLAPMSHRRHLGVTRPEKGYPNTNS